MERYLVVENIRRYESMLRGSLDPPQRQTVEKLLAEEQEKLAALDPRSPGQKSPQAVSTDKRQGGSQSSGVIE